MFSGTMSVLALLFSIASFVYVNYGRRAYEDRHARISS